MVRARAGNRTDLATRVPIATTPDQSYGTATAQRQAQEILPVAAPPVENAPPASPAPVAAGTGGPPPNAGGEIPDLSHQGGPKPGELGWLTPSPKGIPLTHGLPVGPGGGREVLPPQAQQAIATQENEAGNLSHLLGALASQPNSSSAIKALAAKASGGGSLD